MAVGYRRTGVWLAALAATALTAWLLVEFVTWAVILVHSTIHFLPWKVGVAVRYLALYGVALIAPAAVMRASWEWLYRNGDRHGFVVGFLISLFLLAVFVPVLLAYNIADLLGR
jgi:hypothetical protein